MTILLSLAAVATLAAAPAGADSVPTVGKRPVILFWTDKPALVPDATYLTPGITLTPAASSDPLSQGSLLAEGVMPLKWCPGQSLAGESDSQILETWAKIAREGYVGLGIDELGGLNHARNVRFARLLVRFHAEHPSVYVAVWSAGIIDPALARAYKSSVNLVMIETYGPWGLHQFERFIVRLAEARLFGIVGKCIFGIGIDDAAPPDVLKSWGRWSNDPRDLEAQVSWIARYASDMAGVGFFAAYASDRMLTVADELAHRYFPARADAAVTGPRR